MVYGSTVYRAPSAGILEKHSFLMHLASTDTEYVTFVLLTLPACSDIQNERLLAMLSTHIGRDLCKRAGNMSLDQEVL